MLWAEYVHSISPLNCRTEKFNAQVQKWRKKAGAAAYIWQQPQGGSLSIFPLIYHH